MPLRRLPWPCSRIERDVLHDLWRESQRTRMPITAIIKTAVDRHLNARLDTISQTRPAIPFPGLPTSPQPAA